jgi:hypothetical protein
LQSRGKKFSWLIVGGVAACISLLFSRLAMMPALSFLDDSQWPMSEMLSGVRMQDAG